METCFATLLYKHLLVWIDDLLLYADDIDTYLGKLDELFSLLNDFGLKLSVKKSSLYQQEVKWCGKIIDANGVRHDPARIDSLRAMPYPSTAGELQQFLCAINWMRESLIDYARQVSPLQHRLDEALAKTRRTKRVAAGILIELSAAERAAFDNVKDMLASAATLAFPNDSATTCLLTDASDIGWAVIVTQVKDFDIKVPVQDQQHQLVECLSGTFTGSQLNWTVIEKEAFPIALACDKLDYLLLRPQGFRMFCDHRNLIHVFAPDENVKKHVKGKLLRWSMKLMNYNYVIEHIAGPNNVWADMISRWAGNHVPVTSRISRIRTDTPAAPSAASQQELAREVTGPIISTLRPLDDDNFIWPTFVEIILVQSRYEPPSGAVRTDDDVFTLRDRIWIPTEASDLILRLFIIAHCGAQGHRGHAAMVEHLRRLFAIEKLNTLASTFVRQCRLCLHSKGGNIIPRPWGETIDCCERNGVLHFDFLFMGESFGDSKYILVLKDHASHFCELVVADTADSTVTVEAFLAWHSRFGLPPVWISDQGSHFKNEVVSELSRRLRTQQQFTPAYCPWINGSVERVNRDILQVIRTMILEYKINHSDWVYLVPMVQSSLNHTAVPSLGHKAPVELFTGLPCPTPLKEFYLPGSGEFKEVPASDKIDDFLVNLRSSIQDMHKAVEEQRLKQRLLNKKRERGENMVNFMEGDYVLRSRVDEKNGNKLLVTWVGPYRVMRADVHSFMVQHLITGAELDVHASRLKFYADSSLDVTEELLEHISSQGIILAVEKLKEHQWNDNIKDYEILVQWKGLEAIEDSYEPLTTLSRDVPKLVNQYVAAADQELKAHWQRVTMTGDQQLQEPIVATEMVRPTDMSRRRSSRRRKQPRSTTTTTTQASDKGDTVAATLQTSSDRPGLENNQPDANTPKRLTQVRAEDQGVSRRTRSQTARAD
ncbi:Transposon Ty3-G Gag-Pol polyprotein [Phytophthora ramorum]|uniref:Transposon Ty3-G Gag-Pol polyprotein n=1 Tax=Phytophthora ramorum TaxID=164328 RepID=UPI003099EC46|nr:Transposon Ty3-G Gag-Pol polyprotein [Phytophthora ramorum]